MRKPVAVILLFVLSLTMVVPAYAVLQLPDDVKIGIPSDRIDLTKPLFKKSIICGKVIVETVEIGSIKAKIYTLKNKDCIIIPINAIPMANRFQYLSGYKLNFKVFGKDIFLYAIDKKAPQPISLPLPNAF